MTATATDSFSAILRERTAADHQNAEHSPFITAFMRGQLPEAGYIDMLAQHWYLYEALERWSAEQAGDPVFAPFNVEGLARLDALSGDLEDLAGADWKAAYPPVEATERYVARVNEVGADWIGGLIAHHYTRYLGDLSGGIIMGRMAAKAYGFGEDKAGRFARFDLIEDPNAVKEAYRAALDAAPWDTEEQIRVVDEIRAAYAFNQEVFTQLGHHVPEA